eukprot:5942433-Pyramimonas_sp.AAC.1
MHTHIYIEIEVLRAFGISEHTVYGSMALHENCITSLHFNASEPAHIKLCRYIEQGCLLNGLLFSLCFDPVVRLEDQIDGD